MALYASPTWWNSMKAQPNPTEKVQNKALQYILGAFHTTLIYAMQIEALMPPILELPNYINDHKANTANHLHMCHPIAHHLPNPHRSHHITTEDGLLFQELHKPIGAHTSTASKQQHQIKNAKCTSLF